MDHVLSLPVRSQMKKNAVTIRDERTRKKTSFFFLSDVCRYAVYVQQNNAK